MQLCHETFTEEIPFKYPGTRITYRAANWIKGFLQQKMSIKAIQELTSIHWDTIRKVQREIMDEAILERKKMLREEGYKPRILAVDEFANHKRNLRDGSGAGRYLMGRKRQSDEGF